MTDEEEKKNIETENARVGYQAAVSLAISADNLTWERVNLTIVANSIFVGAIVLAFGQRFSPILVVILCAVGFTLNMLWLHLFSRAYDYQNYLIASARELELCLKPIKTLVRGAGFAEGRTVEIRIAKEETKGEEKTKPYQMSAFSNLLRAKHTCWFVILTFQIFYVLMLVLSHLTCFRIHC